MSQNMIISYTVNVEVERQEGPFESKDVLGDEIQELIESAVDGDVEGQNGGIYVINEVDVQRS